MEKELYDRQMGYYTSDRYNRMRAFACGDTLHEKFKRIGAYWERMTNRDT